MLAKERRGAGQETRRLANLVAQLTGRVEWRAGVAGIVDARVCATLDESVAHKMAASVAVAGVVGCCGSGG